MSDVTSVDDTNFGWLTDRGLRHVVNISSFRRLPSHHHNIVDGQWCHLLIISPFIWISDELPSA